MTTVLISVTIFAHLILPLLFFLWIFKSKVSSKSQWFTIVALVASYLVMMWLGGAGWDWFGQYWPKIFLILFVVCVVMSWSKRKSLTLMPAKKVKPWLGLVSLLVIVISLISTALDTITAREYPKEAAIELLFPLKGGTFHVSHGGSNEVMNHHFMIDAQQFALDMVKLNDWGTRAMGLLPAEIEKYAIFGNDVLAPCSGEVISSKTNLKDMAPQHGDPENLLGNHVIIFCKEASVLLAHFKQDSLQLKAGDLVEEGKVIGKVGNSGNTSEPHLHIHAVAGKHSEESEIADTAEGIPMVFRNEGFLIRNDRVVNP